MSLEKPEVISENLAKFLSEIRDFRKAWEYHYLISDCGRVFNLKLYRESKICTDKDGYQIVSVTIGKVRQYRLHRLVLQLFNPPEDESLEVNHINGKKEDNRLENLEWCTRQENMTHIFTSGIRKSRVKPETVYDMIECYKSGIPLPLIARYYQVPPHTLKSILQGKFLAQYSADYLNSSSVYGAQSTSK